MISTIEKLAGLAHWPRTAAAPVLLSPAAVKMSPLPVVVDPVAWCDDHFALLQQLLHLVTKAIAGRTGRNNEALSKSIGLAHSALKHHAALAVSDALPTVLSRDGKYPIPYQRLAEARAKVQVLTAELAQAREELAATKVEGWHPEFDAMSPRQEELAIQFCQEIAGRKGELGRLPDPVRLLEMAQALYEAERSDCAPNAREAS